MGAYKYDSTQLLSLINCYYSIRQRAAHVSEGRHVHRVLSYETDPAIRRGAYLITSLSPACQVWKLWAGFGHAASSSMNKSVDRHVRCLKHNAGDLLAPTGHGAMLHQARDSSKTMVLSLRKPAK